MKYGTREISLTFGREAVRLRPLEPELSAGPEALGALLTARLAPLPGGVSNVGIVVADKTRLCEYPLYLPVLTDFLLKAGIRASDITFYIAYGTHPPAAEEECLACYGDTYRKFAFVHHNSRALEDFRDLGITSRGTVIRIAEAALRHDLLISFGAILHHYFAGYGGGRKLLFPGLAAYGSILENHRLFLDFESRTTARGCASGELDHNPLALDLEEINRVLPPRLEIHALLNSRKQVCELYAGSSYADFREVCRRYDHFFRAASSEQFYDLVVASAGGYPRDINFIQAHKSIHNAASFVKDGGKLVIFVACSDGIGNPDLMDIFALGGREEIFRQLEKGYRNNAGTVLSMLEKSARVDIRMVTRLEREVCERMGASWHESQEVQQLIDEEKGSVAVLEHAGMFYR